MMTWTNSFSVYMIVFWLECTFKGGPIIKIHTSFMGSPWHCKMWYLKGKYEVLSEGEVSNVGFHASSVQVVSPAMLVLVVPHHLAICRLCSAQDLPVVLGLHRLQHARPKYRAPHSDYVLFICNMQ